MAANINSLDIPTEKNGHIKDIRDISTVTFCGCGFLGVYLVGAATYLQDHMPHVLKGRVAGSSIGSLVAVCIVCDIPLKKVRESILSTAKNSQKYILGAYNPFFPLEESLIRSILDLLPDDAHITASGRLFLSLTRAVTLSNEIVSEYVTRDALIQAVICSCFLPGFSGFSVPTFNGTRYVDGGMSNNRPLAGPGTLSINAFAGDFDIKPDLNGNVMSRWLPRFFHVDIDLTNAKKVIQALYPPTPEVLDKYYYFGYADAQKYFPVAGGSRRKSFLDNFF